MYELDVDRSVKIITSIALIFLLIFGYICYIYDELKIFVVLVLFIFFLFLMMPTSVEIKSDHIKVNRVLGSVKCPISKDVEILDDLGIGLLIGTAGLFGWYGVYSIRGKTALVYSRKNKNLVLIKAGRNYVFGVKDPDEFISKLKQSDGKTTCVLNTGKLSQ